MPAPIKLAAKRALVRRLWNDGDSSHADIAAATGLSVDAVAAWLEAQPGYPGLIVPRMVTCGVCREQFPVWCGYRVTYCSAWCRAEGRRWHWRAGRRRRQGRPDDGQRLRCRGLSNADKRVLKQAGNEARERGVPRDVVLREWKFEPQRSTTT